MSSAEKNGAEISQIIDCTAIIETLIEKTSERHAASIQSISDDVKSQQKLIMEQQNQIKDMATMVTGTASLIKQKIKWEGNPNPNTTSTGLNVPDGARLPLDLNVSNETWSTSGDDQASLQASNFFFQGVDHHEAQSKPNPDDQPKEGDGRTHASSANPDQAYWISSVDEYAHEVQYGPEVSWPIAGATKMFWQKPIKPDSLKAKLEQTKIPANCLFLNSKRVNSSVCTGISVAQRTNDVGLQEIQKTHAASVSLILKAASEFTNLLSKSIFSKDGIMIPLTMLKDSLSLAEKMSQSINQLRRKLIKPALPPEFSKLAEKSEESSEWLFGNSISESVENLEKKNMLKSLLKDKKDSGKRKYSEESSNSRSSSKSQKRSPEYGQNFRGYQPRP